jgi:hypothetical protein
MSIEKIELNWPHAPIMIVRFRGTPLGILAWAHEMETVGRGDEMNITEGRGKPLRIKAVCGCCEPWTQRPSGYKDFDRFEHLRRSLASKIRRTCEENWIHDLVFQRWNLYGLLEQVDNLLLLEHAKRFVRFGDYQVVLDRTEHLPPWMDKPSNFERC